MLLRPEGRVDSHYVRGARFHPSAFSRLHHGQRVEVELVPEPGNPHDRWAVALYIDSDRIGYIASEMAGPWQDFVVTCNRRGTAVCALGVIDKERGNVAATIFLPWEKELGSLAMEEGVVLQCDRLIAVLAPEERREIVATGGWNGLTSKHAKILHRAKTMAPDLNWKSNSKGHKWDSIPSQIVWRIESLKDGEENSRRHSKGK